MTFRERWRDFWRPPDSRMVEFGLRGELAVARIRLAIVVLIGGVPLVAALRYRTPPDVLGLAVLTAAAVVAALTLRVARRSHWPRLGLVTGLLDVSLVSLALGLYVGLGRPDLALNSRVTFLVYFLAIGASALRYDRRVCVVVGAAAIAEYLAVILAAAARFDLYAPSFAAGGYGRFEWSSQLNRMVLLAIAALLAAIVVERTQLLLGAVAAAERRLAELSRRLIKAHEEERQRIARELHDELGQALTALKLRLLALAGTPGPEGAAPAQVAECLEIANDTMARTRDLALALRPSMLDDLGLEAAIRWHAERLAQGAGFVVNLATRGAPSALSAEGTTACFRVAQEALTNVARHAEARRVDIELEATDGQCRLVIRDDGRGFNVAEGARRARQSGRLGLIGMRERVRLIGGRLRIRSEPGAGTTVEAVLPLGGEAAAASGDA